MNRETLKRQIMVRLRKIIWQLEQSAKMAEAYNMITDEVPVDMGWELSMINCAKKELECWECDDMDGVNLWSARMQELAGMEA